MTSSSPSPTTPAVASDTSDREIVTVRLIRAPRALVFRAFIDPEQVVKWWGPNGFTSTISEMDVRPGGNWRFIMHGPDGTDYTNNCIYREIVEPERLVYDHASTPKFTAVITFEDVNGDTLLTSRSILESAEIRVMVVEKFGAVAGAEQHLSRLERHMAFLGREEILTITREFDAPRDLVWKVWSEPAHLSQWWGPKGFDVKIAAMDFQSGGRCLYTMQLPDGDVWWGKFEYREISAPTRLTWLNSFSDPEGGTTRHPLWEQGPLEILNDVKLTESGGKTTVTLRAVPFNATVEERASFNSMHSSMEQGYGGTMDQLADYLASLKETTQS
ncbi:MAG: SRPBCC family protein [bacterium]